VAASYAIADSGGTAGAVIFTDSEYAIATGKARAMAAAPGRGATAPSSRFTCLLTINGSYVGGRKSSSSGARRHADQPPFSLSAGDGDASELARIRTGDCRKATVAEALNLQGCPPRLITQADVPNGAVFDPSTGYRTNYRRIWDPYLQFRDASLAARSAPGAQHVSRGRVMCCLPDLHVDD